MFSSAQHRQSVWAHICKQCRILEPCVPSGHLYSCGVDVGEDFQSKETMSGSMVSPGRSSLNTPGDGGQRQGGPRLQPSRGGASSDSIGAPDTAPATVLPRPSFFRKVGQISGNLLYKVVDNVSFVGEVLADFLEVGKSEWEVLAEEAERKRREDSERAKTVVDQQLVQLEEGRPPVSGRGSSASAGLARADPGVQSVEVSASVAGGSC